MDKELNKNRVQKLLGSKYDRIHSAVKKIAQDAGVIIPPLTEGDSYSWHFSGDDWLLVKDIADERLRSELAEEYLIRIKRLIASPEFSRHCSNPKDIFSIPSEDCFFYRDSGERGWQFAITGWGMKIKGQERGFNIEVLVIPGLKKQEVNIVFTWNGVNLNDFVFYLTNNGKKEKHKTDNLSRSDDDDEPKDGIYHLDKPVPIGTVLQLCTEDGKEYSLTVEEGKSLYEFPLTKFFNVEITVLQDGVPAVNRKCELVGIGDSTQFTDDSGMIKIQFPLVGDGKGQPKNPQPDLTVYCGGKKQSQTPADGALLKYRFEFVTPPPPPPEPEFVTVSSWDVGDFYAPDLPVIVKTKIKGKVEMKFDSEGLLTIPKEWFTDGECVKIWTPRKVMKEYAKHHDCHINKPKKHVENQ